MSTKTFKYYGLLGNGIAFANITTPNERLNFTGSTTQLPGTVNGRRIPVVQNKIVLAIPTLVLPEGCVDVCSALSATISASVQFSSPVESITDLQDVWSKLKDAVDTAIADHSILLGFRPAASSTFVLE